MSGCVGATRKANSRFAHCGRSSRSRAPTGACSKTTSELNNGAACPAPAHLRISGSGAQACGRIERHCARTACSHRDSGNAGSAARRIGTELMNSPTEPAKGSGGRPRKATVTPNVTSVSPL